MALRRKRPVYAAGIIERFDGQILIALPADQVEASRQWIFPRGRARPEESPESAMRRVAEDDLGLGVEIVVGQPPLTATIEREEVEVRFFFCGVAHGELQPGPYEQVQWIPKAHLREYDFDEVSRPVAEWLLGSKE